MSSVAGIVSALPRADVELRTVPRAGDVVIRTTSPSPSGPPSCVQTSSMQKTLAVDVKQHDQPIVDFEQSACRGRECRQSAATLTNSSDIVPIAQQLFVFANAAGDRQSQRFANAFDRDAIEDLLEESGDDHPDRFLAE